MCGHSSIAWVMRREGSRKARKKETQLCLGINGWEGWHEEKGKLIPSGATNPEGLIILPEISQLLDVK